MKNRLFFIIATCFTLFICPLYSQDNVIDEIIWVVGDEPILRSEVEEQRLNAQFEGIKFSGDPYCIIPEELAVNKLYLHQADLDSIEVSESDVVNEVDRRMNWMITRLGSKEKLEEHYIMPYDKIREIQRNRVREEILIEQVKAKLLENISVTPSEVRRFYKDLL